MKFDFWKNTIIICFLFLVLQILAAPILATLAVAIGVPILLFYVYGVVPVSLCRSSGCGVSASTSGVRLDFDEPDYMNQNIMANKMGGGGQSVSVDVDTVSHKENNPSIGEVSLSLGSGTHLENLGREQDRESSSTVALAGSILAHKWVFIKFLRVADHRRLVFLLRTEQNWSIEPLWRTHV